jgi:hypothetical protein
MVVFTLSQVSEKFNILPENQNDIPQQPWKGYRGPTPPPPVLPYTNRSLFLCFHAKMVKIILTNTRGKNKTQFVSFWLIAFIINAFKEIIFLYFFLTVFFVKKNISYHFLKLLIYHTLQGIHSF